MKKFINSVDDAVQEAAAGLVAAHAAQLALHVDPLFVHRRVAKRDRVALVSGGGSGHEPLHTGYVGHGMLDAACPGDIFTAPNPEQIAEAARQVDAGRGVLFIVKNYAGDSAAFDVASRMFEGDHATVLVNDDVAVESSTHTAGRRGIAGTVVVEKMVGAAAEAGADLYECKAVGDRVNAVTASMGVAFTSCVVPAAGAPTFEIGANEMEVGVGIHGEPGRYRTPWMSADAIATLLLDAIVKDLELEAGRRVLLLVNGFGGTPLMELHLLNEVATRRLKELGLEPVRFLVGNQAGALETAGASLTLTALDDELADLWDASVHTAALRW